MSVLKLNSVSKTFGETRALIDVSLEFSPESITAVIGRSGCGKSTLLRACNGLVVPDRGTVEVFGEALTRENLPGQRREMGYAVQGTGLFPHLSARQNITLLASLQKWEPERCEQRMAELAKLTQLDEKQLNQYPHQLSGGQQQRVGLCRAMMLHPQILLLDEPFAAIDPITRKDIHHHLLELHRAEPTTAVLVTHDMREAMLLADHIVIMEQGRICSSTSTTEIRDEYPGQEPEELLQLLMEQAGS